MPKQVSTPKPKHRRLRGTVALVLGLLTCAQSWGQAQQAPPKDLTTTSIEDLMKIEVTSASRKSEALSEAPAAIFVVTSEDIRRGGFSSVPDALRIVPGLHVAQQSSHVWLVNARGFSNLFNAKMLVLIDGRLAYTPTFGGVWWDVQDPPLEDIERIEVIRGPGGTLWGANAVNGVINIVTKNAGDTRGGLVASSAGVNEGYATRFRYGGAVAERLSYRIYGTGNYWLPSVNASGAENNDAWNIVQGGIRIDWTASEKNTITFDGQGYSGRVRDSAEQLSPTAPPVVANLNSVVKGGHVLANWKHEFNGRSSASVLGYCDWTARAIGLWGEQRDLCNVEFQHNYSLSARQSLNWGAEVMTTGLSSQSVFSFELVPSHRRTTTYSTFLQYEFVLVPDKFRVIGGSKFEEDDLTGFEYQPQIRAIWTPKTSHTMWVAVSRAVRTPTLAEMSGTLRVAQLSAAPLTFLDFVNNPESDSEAVHAYEFGYRYACKQKFSVDAALYYNGYNGLLGPKVPGAPRVNPAPFYIDIPLAYTNAGAGQTHGLELFLQYKPIRRWTLSTGITELRGNSVAGLVVTATGNDPRHAVTARSKLDLTQHLNLDAAYYYSDSIAHTLPPVNRADVGVSTKPLGGFTFSVWGRNLQADRHQEAVPFLALAGGIRRSVVFKLMWEITRDNAQGRP
ncbi:MAG TPA: TonB-dependent receptor [Candidatus Acidoferrum sp.]|nr:TonB-dependent receptor [Candidatus Acidoferrum sp.]